MATISKKSRVLTPVLALLLTFCSFYLISCQQGNGEKGEWIPIPPDTSSLAKIDHFIPMDDMRKFMADFDIAKDSLSKLAPNLMIANIEAFNKPALLEVLKNPKCVGLRIYFGTRNLDGKGSLRLIIVGVDEQGKDLYIRQGSTLTTQGGDGGRDGGLEYGQCTPPCVP